MSIFVTSDLHGYPLAKFQRLLSLAGFSERDVLYVLGDVIDRNGDGGIEDLLWMMKQPNLKFILGNHEDMMLACEFSYTGVGEIDLSTLSDEQMRLLMRWMRNGATPTIQSLKALPAEIRNALLDYLRNAPLYERVTVGERRFLLVHTGIGNFEPEKQLDEYVPHDFIWYRPSPEERYWDDLTVVMGHTPTRTFGEKDRAFTTDTWIDIDTGAADGGHPMLLRLDDMREFYAEGEWKWD